LFIKYKHNKIFSHISSSVPDCECRRFGSAWTGDTATSSAYTTTRYSLCNLIMKLTNHVCLVLRLRMNGGILSLPHIPSWLLYLNTV